MYLCPRIYILFINTIILFLLVELAHSDLNGTEVTTSSYHQGGSQNLNGTAVTTSSYHQGGSQSFYGTEIATSSYNQGAIQDFGYHCTFEKSMCYWEQMKTDIFDWTRSRGSTSSHFTGPESDHTTPFGYYIYIETSSPRQARDIATLIGPLVRADSTSFCFKFWYNMYGSGIGTLNVVVKYNNNDETILIWTEKGDQGRGWKNAEVTILSNANFQVVIDGVRGPNYQGDIAVDDTDLTAGSCSGDISTKGFGYHCTFENGMCYWGQIKTDIFNWTRDEGSTSSIDTGPSSDHIITSGYYIYIETSSPRRAHENARLFGPMVSSDLSTSFCFKFWYSMYGIDIGTLNVFVKSIGQSQKIWTKTGNQGRRWKHVEVTIQTSGKFQIVIEGVPGPGYRGDIAVDDTDLTNGSCSGDTSNTDANVLAGYIGCFIDTPARILKVHFASSSNNSGFHCKQDCAMYGYSYAGTQNFDECYCGNSIQSYTNTTDTDCNMACPGNKHEICGGLWRMSVYYTGGAANYTQNSSVGYNCTFDTTICYWRQGKADNFDWIRHSGRTPSSLTGPSTGHYGYYMYIETSSPRYSGEYAELLGPSFNVRVHENMCFTFWYNMYGNGIGTLTVYVTDGKQSRNLWSTSGSKGTAWWKASVDLTGYYDHMQIVIRGVRGSDYYGDIAIDDTLLVYGKCKNTNNIPTVTGNAPVHNNEPYHEPTNTAISGGIVVVIVSSAVMLIIVVIIIHRWRKKSKNQNVRPVTISDEHLENSRPFALTTSQPETPAHEPLAETTLDHSSYNWSSNTTQAENQYDPPDYETLFTENNGQEMESPDVNGTGPHLQPFTISLPSIDEQVDNLAPLTGSNPTASPTEPANEEDTPPPAYWTLSATYFRRQNEQTDDSQPPPYPGNSK